MSIEDTIPDKNATEDKNNIVYETGCGSCEAV